VGRDIEEQLVKYLTDAHAIEVQALAQLRRAPAMAGDPHFAQVLRDHHGETERHEALVRARLEAHGATPSHLKDAVMGAGGVGFALFAKSQPDTPGKLASHAFSYEHLELAAYELLARVAARASDEETVAVARRIRDEEGAMARRIAGVFDETVEASLHDAAGGQLLRYLADAHALETQAAELLAKACEVGGHPDLEAAYAEHLEETREHRAAVAGLLDARDASPSMVKDTAMKLGGINWALFFTAQPDTPGKLAAFAYAFEHLEVAGYEQLRRVARDAGDHEAVEVAERLLREEHRAASRIAAAFDIAVEASLSAVGVAA
jgi:ferritin-like metal-binding protein YciE